MYSYIHPLLSRNKGNKIENNGDHLQHEPTKRWLLLTLELSPGEHPWKRWHDDLPKGTTGLNLDHIYQKIRVTFNKLYVFFFTSISLVGCDVPPKTPGHMKLPLVMGMRPLRKTASAVNDLELDWGDYLRTNLAGRSTLKWRFIAGHIMNNHL